MAKEPQLTPVGNIDAICPYCQRSLDKKPGGKKKCPGCEQFIYVRTRPIDRQKVLLTEAQAQLVEEQWAIVDGTHEEYVKRRQLAEKEKTKLMERFGRAPSKNDLKWALLNKEIVEHARKENWGFYRNARFQMAEILRKESKLKAALSMYLWVCYLDLNGPDNAEGRKEFGLLDKFPPFSVKRAFSAPGIIGHVEKLVAQLNLGQEETQKLFFEMADREYQALKLPLSPVQAWEKLKQELFGASKSGAS